ncbi:PDZ domain-containing protein 4 isoform X2 [Stigmatopora argus]
MGCNMCVVRRPEERYKIMYQQKGRSNSLQPMERHGNEKGKGRRRCHLPPDRQLRSQEPLQQPGSNIKGHKSKGVMASTGNGTQSTSISTFAGVSHLRESVDSATQTDVSFRELPPTPSLPHLTEAYQIDDFSCMFVDSDDYLDVSRHDVDRSDELEYEEVALYKSHQEEKLGLTVCYMTDDEDQQGIYVGEVNPNSLAAKNGRIREGDRILQINGIDIDSREEAVAMLSREDSGNFSLLLARPDMEEDQFVDGITTEHLSPYFQLHLRGEREKGGELEDGEEDDDEEGNRAEPPVPLPPLLQLTPLLSNSQDLDSGFGRTDDSMRYDESSEHDLLGGTSSACNTDVTNTPRSARKFYLGHSPRLSPRPSPVVGSSPKMSPSPVHIREDTPPLSPHLRELQLSTNSSAALDGTEERSTQNHAHQKLQLHKSPVNLIATMAGLTEDECQRYQELLEIRYHCDTRPRTREGEEERTEKEKVLPSAMDVNCNLTMSEREMALIEEELRHLEFKWRNILRAQKMQQLRERYLKAWMMEEETVEAVQGDNNDDRHELAAINELPEHSNNGKDSTSAYGSGESCRSTPLVSTMWIPPLPENEAPKSPPHHWGRRHSNLGCGSWNGDLVNTSPSKFRPPSREVDSPARRGMPEETRGSRTGIAPTRLQGGSAESSPFMAQRRQNRAKAFERYHSCMALPSEGLLEPLDGESAEEDRVPGSVPASPRSISSAPCALEHHHTASRLRLALPLALENSSPTAATQRMEWKVKIRSDGTRYVAKRPVRDRLLKARAMQIREERGGTTTDDDAAASEMKLGRYWSKEERKQQLLRAREYRRRREFMMQSRLDYLKGDRDAGSSASGNVELSVQNDTIKPLSQKKISRKRNRRILDNWNTIQELLAHGSRSPDGKKIFNPLLSVTTV